MARYADLDRQRQEHIAVNQHALLLALDALARATDLPMEQWVKEISQRANEHVNQCNEAQIAAVIEVLDCKYDS